MGHTTTATAHDGTPLYVEIDGDGPVVLFLHEVAGDVRSWNPQVRAVRHRYTCVRFNARGFPPSGVPDDPQRYGQDVAVSDAVAVLDHLGIDRAHLVGLSMGGFCALHLCLGQPHRVRSALVAGVGYGSPPADRPMFAREAAAAAAMFAADVRSAATRYANGPTRVQLLRKHPSEWNALVQRLAGHDPIGQSLTFAQVQAKRPSLHDLVTDLARIDTPILLLVGDEDDGCLETNLMLKRAIPASALHVLPHTGHTVDLEEPAAFTQALGSLIDTVEAGAWPSRDPASVGRGLVGLHTGSPT